MGRSLSGLRAKIARPPSSMTSAPSACTLGWPPRVAATGRSRSTCLWRLTASCRAAKAFPLRSCAASGAASAAAAAADGGGRADASAPSPAIYRGLAGASKFPAGLGTAVLRQPCQ